MRNIKLVFFLFLDIISITLSYYLALLFRFENGISGIYLEFYYANIIPVTIIKLAVFCYFNLHKSLWKYAGFEELLGVLIAVTVANIGMLGYLFITDQAFSIGIILLIAIMDNYSRRN